MAASVRVENMMASIERKEDSMLWLHRTIVLRMLIPAVLILLVKILPILRLIKAALNFFHYHPAQRVLVYLEEAECSGIVIMRYADGCEVDVEVSKKPYIHRTCFFTHEQLNAWNPRQENPRISALFA